MRSLRRHVRFPTQFEATICYRGREFPVAVRDISEHGAMVQGLELPDARAQIGLRGESLDVAATIMWRDGDMAGIQFQTAINPLEVVRNNHPDFLRFKGRSAKGEAATGKAAA